MKNLVLLSTFLFLSACATSVNVDYQPGTNFYNIKTYRVEEKAVAVADDPRINSPFTFKRIAEALQAQLSKKGMWVDEAKADVIIRYHLAIRQELESDYSGLSIGLGTSSRHTAIGFVYGFPATEVATIENLTLTIDMVKVKTDQLLWRGSLTSRLMAGSTPESSTKMINGMVKEILDQFPPK